MHDLPADSGLTSYGAPSFVMSRIREEAGRRPSFREARTHAAGITGGTVTSAGIILAGTFVILGIVGRSNAEVEQVGFAG